jgi:hypothetical protein
MPQSEAPHACHKGAAKRDLGHPLLLLVLFFLKGFGLDGICLGSNLRFSSAVLARCTRPRHFLLLFLLIFDCLGNFSRLATLERLPTYSNAPSQLHAACAESISRAKTITF